jgi:hypothetical protein
MQQSDKMHIFSESMGVESASQAQWACANASDAGEMVFFNLSNLQEWLQPLIAAKEWGR